MSVVELLQPHHDRKSFDCGKESLNRFLQQQARQNADRNVGVTHVVVAESGDSKILGYYTLVTRTVESQIVPAKKLPSGPVGVVLLGRLAVDKDAQGQGLGKRMLLRAMKQTEETSRTIGIFALVLDALDEQARSWYLSLGWGFEALLDDPNHLFLAVETIRALSLE
ncbi:GNAT family N-acetyltransferase [Armatimonas sp.]|uniref:GNAT family N-acetyltransferase n=1 Tax=Armatimonas sp. TaxID=1872638 RepID=UPI00286C836F|nr:GNAT family N-acetyltransferase [Armatimonas sp.]